MKKNLLFFCFLALSFYSSASIFKVQYNNLVSKLDIKGNKSVSIAVLDHREQIVKDGKSEDCVGFIRSSVGIPYIIETSSKKSFANDFSSSLFDTFSHQGFKCSIINTSPKDSIKAVENNLKNSGSEISIFFVIDSWWTDTFMATLLEYNFTVFIYNKNGNLLVSKNFTEQKHALGANVWGNEYKKNIPSGFIETLDKVFNAEEIKKALQ